MGLLPLPKAELTDEDVTSALGRAVGLIDLILEVLAEADPLGLRPRLRCADIPGTQAWDAKDRAARVRWWVRRVGALDTVLVAFPGVFGAVADRLPIQDLLGFTNQAIVLCAVAREHGITDTPTRVRMLAEVLCGRDIAADVDADVNSAPPQEPGWAQMSLAGKVWHLAGILNAVGGELGKRPQPRGLFRYLGMLPWLGAVADYFGEYGALVRAAAAAEQWISSHTGRVGSPAGQ
ncbi:hypothetical protein SBI67_07590 [Mycolicibacterium sp. 120266]|uniref:hypothetical protein n=1 Tax=Mycolicibacterium sp. 120266 TaxID=3090601 RepID=UPI00299D7AC5|nr:hypothetical protein [Mycolicibacterium sp. 120266]MDX1871977.1 hypothetical protein [Mycolicibacterium sp. 120266]